MWWRGGRPQVQVDVSLGCTEATEGGSINEVAEEKELWRKRAREFRTSVVVGSAASARQKTQKRFRTKAYRWLCSTDASLRACTGKGWSHFVQEANTTLHHRDWPTISWASDQGSDCCCALNFLLHKRVAVMKVADQPHRIANGADLSLQDVGMAQLVALVSFVMGTDAGPWGEGRWYQSMVEATKNYMAIADPEICPLYNELLPRIASDMGEQHLVTDEAWKRNVFQNLLEVYSRKESRVPSTRCFGFADCAKEFLPKWHTKLCLVDYHLLQAGHFDQPSRMALLQQAATWPAGGAPEGTPDERATIGRGTADERDLRRRCANQLQLQAVVLSDGEVCANIKICIAALAEVRLFHGCQGKANRSTDKVREWFAEQAVGVGLPHLLATARTLSSAPTMQWFGFWLPGDPKPDRTHIPGNEDDPWLLRQNDLAQLFGRLVVRVIGRRLSTMAWSERSLPGKLAGVLVEKDRPSVLAWLRESAETFEAMSKQQDAWWKKAVERSSWPHLVVQKVVALVCGRSLGFRGRGIGNHFRRRC